MSELPDGWRKTTLGEVAQSIRNGLFAARPTNDSTGQRILRISAVRDGRVNLEDTKYVAALTRDQLVKYALDADDLLLTRYNGSRAFVGICGLVPKHVGLVLHPDKLIRVVIPRQVADSRFINLQMEARLARSHMESRIRTTAGQSGISGGDVRATPILLPNLAEQRRIVDILEDHLSRLDAGVALLASTRRRADSWRRGQVDRHIWNMPDIPLKAVGHLLAEPMRNGHSARATQHGESGIRTLTLTAVTRNTFTDAYAKLAAAEPGRVSDLWLRPGDVLVQRSNTPDLVGTTALYTGPENWAIYPDLMIRLRADEGVVLNTWLAAALGSERAHRSLRAKAKGLAGSMPKIDQGAIRSTMIPVPDLQTQQRVLDLLSQHTEAQTRVTTAIEAARLRAASMRKALLAAAFSGRLTGRSSDMDLAEELASAESAP